MMTFSGLPFLYFFFILLPLGDKLDNGSGVDCLSYGRCLPASIVLMFAVDGSLYE